MTHMLIVDYDILAQFEFYNKIEYHSHFYIFASIFISYVSKPSDVLMTDSSKKSRL